MPNEMPNEMNSRVITAIDLFLGSWAQLPKKLKNGTSEKHANIKAYYKNYKLDP